MDKARILAHRGLWSHEEQQNTKLSITNALRSGFGVETDLRDHLGTVVVSHDPVKKGVSPLSFEEVLAEYHSKKYSGLLALNIKSDGLAPAVAKLLGHYELTNYFVFDMSIPDTMSYAKEDVRFALRVSDYEPQHDLHKSACCIWLDSFSASYDRKLAGIASLMKLNDVYIVSPELHNRPFTNVWKQLRAADIGSEVGLCTDHSAQAAEFFK